MIQMQNIRVKEHHRRNNSHPPQKYYEDMISSDVFFWGRTLIFGLKNFLHDHDGRKPHSGRKCGGALELREVEFTSWWQGEYHPLRSQFHPSFGRPENNDGMVVSWRMGWDGMVGFLKRCDACVCCRVPGSARVS